MIGPVLTVAATAIPAAYIIYWRRAEAIKRRTADWKTIVAELRSNHEFGFADIAERYLYSPNIQATSADVWDRIHGVEGLWAMFKNAGVLMRLADYAAEHGGGQAPDELVEELRSDALQLRIAVLVALSRYGLSHSRAAASVNAHRAAVAYGSMLAHMTAYFQEYSALYFPRFLEAM